MSEWAYRKRFRDMAAQHRRTSGLTSEEQAEALGLKENTFNGYLYKKVGKPSLEVLQKAAALWGCSVMEFIDDPGSPVAGVDQGDFSGASEEERVMLRAIAADLERLGPSLRRPAFNAWTAVVNGLLSGSNR